MFGADPVDTGLGVGVTLSLCKISHQVVCGSEQNLQGYNMDIMKN